MSEPVRRSAGAKLNLFLRVLAAESDGWHGIETLFCRVTLADELEVERTAGKGVTLAVDGPDLGPAEENLAFRAADQVLQATGRPFGVSIRLRKRIPVGAGLGGGSADAAAALDAVNELANHAVPRAELFHFAARLGSDVPFCLSGAPLALGWGHGERLLRLDPLPAAPILLLTPPVHIRTAEAYRWVDDVRHGAGRRGGLLLDAESLRSWSDVARMAGNDFESAVFGKHPAVREAFEALARTGPLVCRMSGSGSTLFAVYRGERDRETARDQLGRKHGTVTFTETATTP